MWAELADEGVVLILEAGPATEDHSEPVYARVGMQVVVAVLAHDLHGGDEDV